MKKFVSLLLALTLVLSSVSSVFSFSAAAESTGQTVMDDSYFLYEDHWLINGQNSAKFGSEGQQLESNHLMFTNADYGIHAVDALPDGSGKGLFMNTACYLCGIPLSLQKNTNYDLQFSYYVPQGTTLNATASVLQLAGIFAQDAQDSDFKWDGKGTLAMFADGGKYTNRTSDYSLKYDYTIKSTGISCGRWYTVTLPFYSGENAKLYFGIKTQQNSKIYFKNFKVTQNYFEDLSNWKIYKNDGTGDESATELQMNYAAASQTGGISLKSYNAVNLNKIKLQGIQKNTDYKVSFKYYTTLLKTWTFSSKIVYYAVSKLGIFAPAAATANKFDFGANGALFYADNNPDGGRRSTDATTAISKGTTVENPISTFTEGKITANTWLNAEFCFNSGNYEDLYLMLCCGTGQEMRFDEFEVTPLETKVLGDLAVYTGSSTQVGSHEGATLMAASSGMRFNETTNAEYVVSGLSAYEVHANWQYAAAPLTGLAENTDYILSFKYMTPDLGTQSNIFQEMGLFAADAQNAKLGWATDGYLYRLADNVSASYRSADGVFATRTAFTDFENPSAANVWYQVSLKFNSANFKDIYFVVKTKVADMYLDDFKLQNEVAARQTEINNAFTFNGTAIRAAGTNIKQALRFKTTVDENILTENALTGNATVTEYGFVVLNKDLLNGAELTLNSTYEKNGATVTAPQKAAYNKANGTDIVFEQNGTLKTFTAALTGITENRYSTEYAVRVYVKLSNGEVHYAGETQYMSVYQCAALAFDAEGGTYTDTAGNSWKESYATRSYLFENILKGQTVDGKTYNTAPAAQQ